MATRYFEQDAPRPAVQVSVRLDNEMEWAGTGFFVRASKELEEGVKIDCLLLISNKHVLAGGVGDQLIHLNKKDENGEIRYGDQELLLIDEATHRYMGHKNSEIDLACFDMRGMEIEGYDTSALTEVFVDGLDEEKIGIGSDVLYAGFPNGVKDRKNGLALMRKGSIASIPTMDCDREGLIAIDGTVLPGNSGGPVFVSYEGRYKLLGVMHARSIAADDYGFVIKQRYVKELIDDALEKSANEFREHLNTIIISRLEKGSMGCEVRKIRDEVWGEAKQQLGKVRSGKD